MQNLTLLFILFIPIELKRRTQLIQRAQNIYMKAQNIYFIGQYGTDAGGWYIGRDGKIHRVPGWNPESMVDLASTLGIIRIASQIKDAKFNAGMVKEALAFAQNQLGDHLSEGGIVVVNGH